MKNLILILGLLFNVLLVNAQNNITNDLLSFDDAIEVDNYINVSLYPNPSSGYFTVKMENDTPYDVYIYAMNGMLVYSQENIQESFFRINLENSIAKGFYNVAFRQGENAIVKKLAIR